MYSALDNLAPLFTPELVRREHPLNQGRVLWWLVLPGIEGGRLWLDLLGKNHGTLTAMSNANNGWRTSARVGGWGSLLLDGTAGYVQAAATPVTGPPLTMACWANTKTNANQTVVHVGFSGTTNSWVRINVSGSFNAYILNTGNSAGTQYNAYQKVLVTNTWQRVACTINADGSGILYINGINQGTVSAAAFNAFTTFAAGVMHYSSNIQFFQGNLDDVSMWNRALTAAEIQEDYVLSQNFYPGLLARPLGLLPAVGVEPPPTVTAWPAAILGHL
jgi:hypothetical protein